MRCTACNRPFQATKLTDRAGKTTFETLCSHCRYPGYEGTAYSFEPCHGILEEPTVRLATEHSLKIEEMY